MELCGDEQAGLRTDASSELKSQGVCIQSGLVCTRRYSDD